MRTVRQRLSDYTTGLKTLFVSNTRIKTLAHFYMHADESFYIRELERIIDVRVGALSRELVNLEKGKILVSGFHGNQKRYTINKNHHLYPELRSIFVKTAGAGDMIRKALEVLKGVELVFIYGSFAAGDEYKESDIDIMVVGDCSSVTVTSALSNVEAKLSRQIQCSVFDRFDIQKRIKQRVRFIINVFTGPKVILIGDEGDGLFRIAAETPY